MANISIYAVGKGVFCRRCLQNTLADDAFSCVFTSFSDKSGDKTREEVVRGWGRIRVSRNKSDCHSA